MRPPLTIWRFASVDLWRLILLTTAIVVLVVAFAATVKPMAEGKLGAAAAARFLLLAIPPMLQYVLPFAAGFASTLAFHRMAADNELAAARVGGISFASLLAPAAAAGLALALLLGALTGEIIPRYLRSMDETIRQDLTQILVNSIERGESVRFDDVVIFADRVDRLGPDEKSGAYDVLVLSRVAALVVDKKTGAVKGDGTAARAWVWLRRTSEPGPRGEASTLATFRLERASRDIPGAHRGADEVAVFNRRLPTPFRDDVKFMTWEELRRLPKNPDAHGSVNARRRALAYAIARQDGLAAIDAELRTQSRARLVRDGRFTILLRGSGLVPHEREREVDGERSIERRWLVTPIAPGAPVEIEVLDDGPDDTGGTFRRLLSETAYLTGDAGDDALLPRPTLTLHLAGVQVLGAGGEDDEIDTDAAARDYSALTPGVDPADALLALPSRELLKEADRRLAARPDAATASTAHNLADRLAYLEREITSRVHERAAMSVSCLIMMLTGCVTAIRLKDRLPVPVYLWSFFPGIGAVLTVNAGKEMIRSLGDPGLILLWGGLAALAIYTAAVYWTIRRH